MRSSDFEAFERESLRLVEEAKRLLTRASGLTRIVQDQIDDALAALPETAKWYRLIEDEMREE